MAANACLSRGTRSGMQLLEDVNEVPQHSDKGEERVCDRQCNAAEHPAGGRPRQAGALYPCMQPWHTSPFVVGQPFVASTRGGGLAVNDKGVTDCAAFSGQASITFVV